MDLRPGKEYAGFHLDTWPKKAITVYYNNVIGEKYSKGGVFQ
jgi:hypothetical protein